MDIKGALVMYALREYLGEERMNAVLRDFLEEQRFGDAPYPTSLELHRRLRAATPDSLLYLLEDLTECITFWDLRMRRATVQPTGAGEYAVVLEMEARKVRADSLGNEREIPMDDLIQIGVFARAEQGEAAEPLYLRSHRIRSGAQSIVILVSRRPARAGIDPYRYLLDRRTDDNVVSVGAGG